MTQTPTTGDEQAAVPSPSGNHPLAEPEARGFRRIEIAVAAAVVFTQPLRIYVALGLSIGAALAFVVLPVWIWLLPRFRGARLLVTTIVVAIVSGALTATLVSGHRTVVGRDEIAASAALLNIMVAVCAVLWLRALTSIRTTALVFAAGMLVAGALAPLTDNPLKFNFALPLAVVLLALAEGRRWGVHLFVLGVVGAICVIASIRSLLGTCALAALLILWQMRPQFGHRKSSRLLALAMIAGLGVTVYFTVQSLLVDGALGQAAQDRSQAQIERSGTLILGGRPEMAATLALMKSGPLGFGSGVQPTPEDIAVAKRGLWAIGYDPNNGYVDIYMFGRGFELHSVVGDMWARYGLGGFALTIVIVTLTLSNALRALSRREAGSLILLLALWNTWNVFFSPLYSATPILVIGLALVLPVAKGGSSRPGTKTPEFSRTAPLPIRASEPNA